MWINNPNETSPHFHIRALHPHSIDVMRYFGGDVEKVQAFFKRGPKADGPDGKRVCWSNVQVNLLFKNGIIGHLTGSYDAGGSYGLIGAFAAGAELECLAHAGFAPGGEAVDAEGNVGDVAAHDGDSVVEHSRDLSVVYRRRFGRR